MEGLPYSIMKMGNYPLYVNFSIIAAEHDIIWFTKTRTDQVVGSV